MRRNFILVNTETGEIVGYTSIDNFSTDYNISDEELLSIRLEAAIQDAYVPDTSYVWQKNSCKLGVEL